MEFAKRPKNHSWKTDGHKIEQVSYFKYLSVLLHSANRKKLHEDHISENAQRSLSAILKSHKTRGGHYTSCNTQIIQSQSE